MTIRDRYIKRFVKTSSGLPSDFHKEVMAFIEEVIGEFTPPKGKTQENATGELGGANQEKDI